MLVCSLGYIQKNIFDYHPTTIYDECKEITNRLYGTTGLIVIGR